MDRKTAKDLLHLQRWLDLSATITARGKDAYDADEIGEVAKRLSARGVVAPGVVNWSDAAKNRERLVHHYSITDREVTWSTLSQSLPQWRTALTPLFEEALSTLCQH